MPSKLRRGMWTNEALEEAMDAIERRTHAIRRVSKSWNIPMNSLINHLNGRTKFGKMGLRGVLIKEEDTTMNVDISNVRMWTIH
jgi:hypothetical protein